MVGAGVTLFRPGDELYYAGSNDRPGSYAEFQCVDERIVGRKPRTLSFAEAAALPLTTITAWKYCLIACALRRQRKDHCSSSGGAGGVGSIATQLARQLTRLKIIFTASRSETRDWYQRMGAHGGARQPSQPGRRPSGRSSYSNHKADQHWRGQHCQHEARSQTCRRRENHW